MNMQMRIFVEREQRKFYLGKESAIVVVDCKGEVQVDVEYVDMVTPRTRLCMGMGFGRCKGAFKQ